MRRAGNIDCNQNEIVKALRDAAIGVHITSSLGGGFPDLVCGYRGVTVLLELKPPHPPSKQRLTVAEADWHAKWPGQVCVVTSPDEAVDAVLRACGLLSCGASGIKHSSSEMV